MLTAYQAEIGDNIDNIIYGDNRSSPPRGCLPIKSKGRIFFQFSIVYYIDTANSNKLFSISLE